MRCVCVFKFCIKNHFHLVPGSLQKMTAWKINFCAFFGILQLLETQGDPPTSLKLVCVVGIHLHSD